MEKISVLWRLNKIKLISKCALDADLRLISDQKLIRRYEDIREENSFLMMRTALLFQNKFPHSLIEQSNFEEFFSHQQDLDSFDLVCTIGGDDLFIHASKHIKNSQTSILGINSDPGLSQGHFLKLDLTDDMYDSEKILEDAINRI